MGASGPTISQQYTEAITYNDLRGATYVPQQAITIGALSGVSSVGTSAIAIGTFSINSTPGPCMVNNYPRGFTGITGPRGPCMVVNRPSNPRDGDSYIDSINGNQYIYNGNTWQLAPSSFSFYIDVSQFQGATTGPLQIRPPDTIRFSSETIGIQIERPVIVDLKPPITNPKSKITLQPLINNNKTEMTCSVCLDNNVDTVLTTCSHTYCSECIQKIVHDKSKCPLCRKQFTEVNILTIIL